MKLSVVLALLVFLVPVSGFGADFNCPATGRCYYVSPTGEDGAACNAENPCREIRRALTLVHAGDTVVAADGRYKSLFLQGIMGQANRPITIIAPGGRAELASTSDYDADINRDAMVVQGSSYLVLDGLRAFGAARAAVRVEKSSHVTLRNGTFAHNVELAVLVDSSDDTVVEKCQLYGSKQQHGVFAIGTSQRLVIRQNVIHDSQDSGLRIEAAKGGVISGALIEANVLYANGASGNGAIELAGLQDSVVKNNLIFNNSGFGIVAGKRDAGQGPKGLQLLNNTVVQWPGTHAILNFSSPAGKNVLRNNILYHADVGGEINPGSWDNLDSDYNLYSPVSQAPEETHSVSATLAELFVNAGETPADANYDLVPDSSARHAGEANPAVSVDILARPRNARPSMGAFEGQ